MGLLLGRLGVGRLIQGSDDEGVDRDLAAAEPGGGGRSGHHHDLLALAAAEHVERHDAAAARHLDFEECARGNVLDALGRPVAADDVSTDHGFILSMVMPRLLALSRASGVTLTLAPICSRWVPLGSFNSAVSVTTPLSMRAEALAAGADAVGPA